MGRGSLLRGPCKFLDSETEKKTDFLQLSAKRKMTRAPWGSSRKGCRHSSFKKQKGKERKDERQVASGKKKSKNRKETSHSKSKAPRKEGPSSRNFLTRNASSSMEYQKRYWQLLSKKSKEED